MKRFECDQVSESSTFSSLKRKTDDLHLFYNAESCAMQVLSSTAIKISGFILALILAFLF